MTLKWMGPGYFGKDVAPGDDMPEIDKERLDKFIKLGKVGVVAEKIDLDKIKSDELKALEAENVRLKKAIPPLKGEITRLNTKLATIEKELADVVAAAKGGK